MIIFQGRDARFQLDRDAGLLMQGDRRIDLPRQQYELLQYLLETRPGKLITRDELLNHLWGGKSVNEEALSRALYRLRQALGDDDPEHPSFVETVRGRGVRFVAVIEPHLSSDVPPHEHVVALASPTTMAVRPVVSGASGIAPGSPGKGLEDPSTVTMPVAALAPEALARDQTRVATCEDANDGNWSVNLGFGYAFYVHCSGNEELRAAQYSQIVQLVAEPSQELGLDVSLPAQSAYSTERAINLGHELTSKLRVRGTRLASVFEFVWRILLLLFSSDDGREHPQDERSLLEATLTRAARSCGLLDEQSRQLIHSLAWEDLDAERKKREQDRFVAWAHSKMSASAT